MNSVTAHERAALPIAGRYTVHRATVEEFQESRISWNRLVSGMRYASPFCTWEWIFTWREHFGTQLEMTLLFVNDGAQLCAILPLFRRRGAPASRWFIGEKLEYCGATELHPDHLDIICAPEDAPACVAAVLDYIVTQLPDWAQARLPMLAEDSSLFCALQLSLGTLRVAVRPAAVAPYILLTGNFEDYLARLTKKDRYKIKSPRKKVLEEGTLRYSAFEPAEFETALCTLFELHARRADAKEITSTFGRPSVFEFHRALLQRLNSSDVILRCLKDGANIVAMLYGFRCGNRIFFYQFGYDPEWSWASPGYILVSEAIREAFTLGCVEFNFLHGDEPYKHAFTREVRKLSDCYIYNTTFSGRLARGTFMLRERLKAVVRGGHAAR